MKAAMQNDQGVQRKALRLEDYLGVQYGRLTAISEAPTSSHGQRKFRFQCTCGNFVDVIPSKVVSGHTRSCGCYLKDNPTRLTHGMSGTPTYRSWEAMLRRCRVESDPAYKHYGGRGIEVCSRWLTFTNFLADMGECPKGLTLDRVDENSGYFLENCRWATDLQQGEHRRTNCKLDVGGKVVNQAEAARLAGIPVKTFQARLKAGWSLEKALNTKLGESPGGSALQSSNVFVEYGGERLHQAAMARAHGISPSTFHARLKAGWTEERAITTPVRGNTK